MWFLLATQTAELQKARISADLQSPRLRGQCHTWSFGGLLRLQSRSEGRTSGNDQAREKLEMLDFSLEPDNSHGVFNNNCILPAHRA